MSNQHYNKADELMQQEQAGTGGQYLDPQTTALKTAAVEATLALAYEQRTANLLAYEAGLSRAFKDNAINENGMRLWKLAADQIIERLDLE